MSELASLDSGRWFDAAFSGARLCTLAEAIEAIHAAGCVTLIERKAGDPTTLLDVLCRLHRLDDAIVQAFDWPFLAQCKRLAPRLVVGALGRNEITPERLAEVAAIGARFIGWADANLTADGIALAHSQGLKVLVFTCDDEARAEQLIDWGIDGIISNAPGRIQGIVARHPPPRRPSDV
jgi:glycerophosphoryl diester phosphodiesterase